MPTPTTAEIGSTLSVRPPFSFRWAEVTPPPTGYSHGFQFGTDSSQASWTIDVNWDDFTNSLNPIQAGILGYSKRVGTMMNRNPPVRHPIFNWLYATSITGIHGIKFVGRETFPMVGFSSLTGMVAKYNRVRLTINFTTLPYNVLTDSELQILWSSDESRRWVAKTKDDTAESISINTGQFVFAEGQTGNPKDIPFPLGTNRITTKSDLNWTWFDVPENYIMNSNGVTTNIDACLGKVNNATIWGYPAGTLLCMPPTYTPRNAPVNPGLVGQSAFGPPRMWEVGLKFKYWKPPLGTSATTEGHNTAMYLVDGKFYLIRSKTVTGGTGATLFEGADFNTIFQAVTA